MWDMWEILIYGGFFFALPVALLAFLGISIYRYVSAKKRNKTLPDTFSAREIKNRKIILIIASILSGIFLTIVIGITSLLFLAIAFM